MCDADNSDEDYNFDNDDHHHHISTEKKFPLHDCCEFDDVETLKVSSMIHHLICFCSHHCRSSLFRRCANAKKLW
jgi:hypothetical protein